MAAIIGTVFNANYAESAYNETIGAFFETGLTVLHSNLNTAISALQTNYADPVTLSKFQQALSDYSVYMSSQTNTIKSMKDTESGIAGNLR